MNVLIFKTDINTRQKANDLKRIFDHHPDVGVWSVDMEDVDKVLRIEATDDLSENEVIQLIRPHGISCEVLPD